MVKPGLGQGRMLLVAGLGVLWLSGFGCSSGDGGTAQGGGSYCDVYVARLRECELIDSGRFDACVNYADAAEVCETNCLREASCSEVGFFFCPSGDNSVSQCFRDCIGLAPFSCGDGTELPPHEQCDSAAQCSGGEDEIGCESYEAEYKCRNVDQTVLQTQVCDGQPDCSDGSDELPDCAPVVTCGDGLELQVWAYCNGNEECSDGADEPDGCTVNAC